MAFDAVLGLTTGGQPSPQGALWLEERVFVNLAVSKAGALSQQTPGPFHWRERALYDYFNWKPQSWNMRPWIWLSVTWNRPGVCEAGLLWTFSCRCEILLYLQPNLIHMRQVIIATVHNVYRFSGDKHGLFLDALRLRAS